MNARPQFIYALIIVLGLISCQYASSHFSDRDTSKNGEVELSQTVSSLSHDELYKKVIELCSEYKLVLLNYSDDEDVIIILEGPKAVFKDSINLLENEFRGSISSIEIDTGDKIAKLRMVFN